MPTPSLELPMPVLDLPTPSALLRNDRQTDLNWLHDDTQFDKQTAERFLSSRIVFYPGAGNDGHAFRLFGGTHTACCFVHADYWYAPERIADAVNPASLDRLKGYVPVTKTIFTLDSLRGIIDVDVSHPFGRSIITRGGCADDAPVALWCVLKRDSQLDDNHGPRRLAFLHVAADAVWVYMNLWARRHDAPFAVILQDNAFGGNWSKFGSATSPMGLLASEVNAFPSWLLVGEQTEPWVGYSRASQPDAPAGMHGNLRSLYRRIGGVRGSIAIS